jgi:hypothetical protein
MPSRQHAAGARERQEVLQVVPVEHPYSMQFCEALWQSCACPGVSRWDTLSKSAVSHDHVPRYAPNSQCLHFQERTRKSFMSDATPEPIVKVAMGFMAAKHLFAASEIGVFGALAGGSTSIEDLVVATGIPRRTLQIAIDAMVSFGFIQQQGRLYRNSANASRANRREIEFGSSLVTFSRILCPRTTTWCSS